MFPAQRIEVLKRALKEQKTIDVATLCNLLQVSDVTVRKYLDKLESEGFLVKFHGGAMLAENPDDADDANVTLLEGQEEKTLIAKLARKLVDDGDSIFLGPGSTCWFLAKEVLDVKNLTVVTNNVHVVEVLVPVVKNLQLIGGEIANKDGFMYTYGQKASMHLDGMFVQKAFVTVDGVDVMAGLTTNANELLDMYNRVAHIAKQVIVLADYKKFDKICLHQIAKIKDYNVYISNEKLSPEYKRYFFDNNIKILTSYDL